MTTQIQIYCRRPSLGEVSALIEMGVEYVGWPVHPDDGDGLVGSERIARMLRCAGRVASLLVHSRKTEVLETVAHMVRPDYLLLSSDRRDADMNALASAVSAHTRLMMSVPVRAAGTSADLQSIQLAKAYAAYAGALTVDTIVDPSDLNKFGCTGITNDWDVCREIVMSVNIPVVLAGGLDAHNVSAAITRVRPPIVDACTSLEFSDKSKDLAKCKAFVDAVRRTDSATGAAVAPA